MQSIIVKALLDNTTDFNTTEEKQTGKHLC